VRATFRNLYDELNVAAFVRNRHEHAVSVLRWALILIPMAAVVGTLCGAFLWSLDAITRLRFAFPWLLYLLPIGGFAVGLLYHLAGRSVEGGNNLIVEQIHEPGGGVPLRMAPLIFFGTVVTHLFGGSAGREGTAVQLGGSLASGFGRALRLDADGTRVLLMGGIAAGFGAVFGTPIAGAVFALEVLAIGRVEYRALVPCLVAALVGDWTCLAWGIHHGIYRINAVVPVDALLIAKAGIAGVAQHTHYGFSNHGPIRENGTEAADPHLTICVELVGDRDQLDLFCRRHGDLLSDKVIVYKQLEHWSVTRAIAPTVVRGTPFPKSLCQLLVIETACRRRRSGKIAHNKLPLSKVWIVRVNVWCESQQSGRFGWRRRPVGKHMIYDIPGFHLRRIKAGFGHNVRQTRSL
jgi:hypothetical protein